MCEFSESEKAGGSETERPGLVPGPSHTGALGRLGREAQCSQHQCPRCPGGHRAWPWPDLERTTGPILVVSTEPLEWGIEWCLSPHGPQKRSVCLHALRKRKKGTLGTGLSCGPQGKSGPSSRASIFSAKPGLTCSLLLRSPKPSWGFMNLNFGP